MTRTRAGIGPGAWLWILPLGVLLAFTAADLVFHLDLAVSRVFYDSGSTPKWLLGDSPLARLLEDSVWIPDVALVVAAGVLFFRAARRRQRSLFRAGLILSLSVVVGPVLLTNVLLKPHSGRPRPQDVAEFGGPEPFHPLLEGWHGHGDSFPSGHAAAAFALVLPFFALRQTHPPLARAALISGLAYGCLIGFVRIAHGRHFISDVLWAGGLVWFTGLGFAALVGWMLPDRPARADPIS